VATTGRGLGLGVGLIRWMRRRGRAELDLHDAAGYRASERSTRRIMRARPSSNDTETSGSSSSIFRKGFAVDHEQGHRRFGEDGGGASSAVDQRDLPEMIARQDAMDGPSLHGHLRLPGDRHEEALARLPLLHHRGAFHEVRHLRERAQLLQVSFREPLEQGHAGQHVVELGLRHGASSVRSFFGRA
jgi:hypothetical protein